MTPAKKRMVPLDDDYAFLHAGLVKATIAWWAEPGQRGVKSVIYSVSERIAGLLPRGADLGNQIHELIQANRLVPFDKVAAQHPGLYQIHDLRPGQGRSYMIWTGTGAGDQRPSLLPRTVYHCQGRSSAPILTEYTDVLDLMRTPGAKLITSFKGVRGKNWAEAFGTGKVLVVDLKKVYEAQ